MSSELVIGRLYVVSEAVQLLYMVARTTFVH